MRTTLLVLSDWHCGHKFGLCPPGVTLYDEGPEGELIPYAPELTAFQQAAWEHLTERVLPDANAIAGEGPVYLFLLGDLTHGQKHPEQLLTTRAADQLLIAQAVMEAIVERLPNLLVVRSAAGTGSHDFGEGSATILLGEWLKRLHPDLDVKTVYHGLADVDGCKVDYAHHGPTGGRRVWLWGNEARFHLRDLMMRAILGGGDAPNVFLRGHVHTLVSVTEGIWAGGGMVTSRLVVCPAMCGLSDFARQVTRSQGEVTIGGVAIVTEGGEAHEPVYLTVSWDLRTKEAL